MKKRPRIRVAVDARWRAGHNRSVRRLAVILLLLSLPCAAGLEPTVHAHFQRGHGTGYQRGPQIHAHDDAHEAAPARVNAGNAALTHVVMRTDQGDPPQSVTTFVATVCPLHALAGISAAKATVPAPEARPVTFAPTATRNHDPPGIRPGRSRAPPVRA